MGGKVLVPTREAVEKLLAARLAADVMGVPTIIIARTDADAANLITSDIDDNDKPFVTGERSMEGFYYTAPGWIRPSPAVWPTPPTPTSSGAKRRTRPGGSPPIRRSHSRPVPRQTAGLQLLALVQLEAESGRNTIAIFQEELGKMGYAFQFVTLAGFHSLNASMFQLANDYKNAAWRLTPTSRKRNSSCTRLRLPAIKHQSFVGAGYFDEIQTGHHPRRGVYHGPERLDGRRAVHRRQRPRRCGSRLRLVAEVRQAQKICSEQLVSVFLLLDK
jgi:isocitrate lyase